jgi:hypothetical protein
VVIKFAGDSPAQEAGGTAITGRFGDMTPRMQKVSVPLRQLPERTAKVPAGEG